MCGIAGFVCQSLPESWGDPEGLLRAMTREVAHRGPDDEGFFVQGGAYLGHRRLSIIDLSAGHQPLASADGAAVVVFNGEIYNFRELRAELEGLGRPFLTHSDTEVLVQGYLAWGARELLGRLNGMFAFALWDTRNATLLLARDRLGKKPLYWAVRGRALLFGSELKVLLRHPAVGRRVDPQALREYLLYDAVPAPRSIVEGVHKLPAGGFLEWSGGRVTQQDTYWDLRFPEPLEGSDDELAGRLWELFSDAVRLRLRSDVPLGVFLSGGIDSTAVVTAMAEHMPAHHIQTFSIAFRDPSFDESSHARLVASHVGTEHREEVLEPRVLLEELPGILRILDEPLADNSLIPTYLLSQFTRRHVTVALGGDGGDELWMGYPTFYAHRLARLAERMPATVLRMARKAASLLPVDTSNISFDYKVKRMLLGLESGAFERHFVWIGAFDPAAQESLLSPSLLEATRGSSVFAPVAAHRARVQAPDELAELSYLYAKIYMGDDILAKVDRATMAHALEARAPLLDYRVAEFAAAVPTHMKLRGRCAKFLLKHAMRHKTPHSILARPKKGFGVPVAAWLKGPLREWAAGLLGPERVRRDGYFRPEAVSKLFDDHLEGRADNRKHLWSILVFNLWLDTWAGKEWGP